MSVVTKESIEVVAQSIGITNLSPEVSLSLAPDVDFRVREIMQEAVKCMRHSRRTTLTSDDVDSALSLRNVEPLYGFASGEGPRFKRASGFKDLYYVDDKDIDFRNVIEAPLPTAPVDALVGVHWLAIEGVQPAIPENAPIEALTASFDGKKLDYKEDSLPVDVKLPVKHVLSRELQLYFEKITELCTKRPNSILFKQALLSLTTDAGLHPLVPYFVHFIAEEVARNMNNLYILFALMRITRSLIQNPHIHLELYLHQLMPAITTCLVAKRLGSRLSDNHWELRNLSAMLVASICERFGHVYHNLQPRITRTLLHAFLDLTKSLPQHYGAIQGLSALGPRVVRLLILPNLQPYLLILEPEMLLENQKNEMKRHEALRVYGALMSAAGLCMYDRFKMSPCLLRPPTRPVWKRNAKVRTAMPSKRKASTDNLMQQPPLKKQATDSALGVMAINSMPADPQGVTGGLSNVTSGMALSQVNRHSTHDSMPGRGATGSMSSPSATLNQAWREDVHGGVLLASLFEQFGESMFYYVPKAELSMFL